MEMSGVSINQTEDVIPERLASISSPSVAYVGEGETEAAPDGHHVNGTETRVLMPEGPVTFFQWIERTSNQVFGDKVTDFFIRRRFVLSRVFIVSIYWLVGIEYYHAQENWLRIDCAYFITVTTTTVGYGDFHPTTQSTQLFTVFYAIFGIAFVLSSVTELVNYLIVRKMQPMVLDGLGVVNLESRAWFKLIFSVSCILSMITIGTIFFNVNENWPPATALYWTIITMLTIGYGDLSIGDSSRLFSIWFIWTCVVIYIMALSNIFDTVEELKSAALRTEILRAHLNDDINRLESDRQRDGNTENEGRRRLPGSSITTDNSWASIYHSSSISNPGASDEVVMVESPIETEKRQRGGGGGGGDIELGKATMSPLMDVSNGRPSSSLSSFFQTVEDEGASNNKSRAREGSLEPRPLRNSSVLGPQHGFTDPFRRGSDDNEPMSTRRLNPGAGKRRTSILDDPLLKGKCDRFVLETLVKMKKLNQEKDIDPLVKHFEELGQMRENYKDSSKEVGELCNLAVDFCAISYRFSSFLHSFSLFPPFLAMCTLKLVAKKFLEDKISTNSSTLSSFAATLVGNKKVVVNSHRRESAAESARDASHFHPGGRKTGAETISEEEEDEDD